MFEAYVVIALAIFSALVMFTALSVSILMNKRFMRFYVSKCVEISKETMKMLLTDEINKRTEDSEATAQWQEIV